MSAALPRSIPRRRARAIQSAVRSIGLVTLVVASNFTGAARAIDTNKVVNVVLVHGADLDGSSWRGVYDILNKDGYRVSIVQEPLTSLADDVAATQRVIDQLSGPIVLVGHSYGGTVVTVAGVDPKVKALVYVAALQPDVGESTNRLAASMRGDIPASHIKPTKDGFLFVDPDTYARDLGTDLPPAEAQYLAHAQMPVAAAAFETAVSVAAWHDKPSFGIVATADRALNPQLAHWMYKRSGAQVTEIKANHLVHISQPGPVARVIEAAARAVTAR